MVEIKDLIWDEWNVVHIARHDVTKDEVQELCLGDFVTLAGYAGRLMLVGLTRQERVLSVVLAPKGNGIFYPVTARPASRKERAYYQEQIGGEKVA